MDTKDYLILTKGRAVCIVLDTARGIMAEMKFENSIFENIRKECEADMLNLMIQVATISNGCDQWEEVYALLTDIGISIPEDVEQEMRYMSSVMDILPSDQRHS